MAKIGCVTGVSEEHAVSWLWPCMFTVCEFVFYRIYLHAGLRLLLCQFDTLFKVLGSFDTFLRVGLKLDWLLGQYSDGQFSDSPAHS